MSSLTPNFKDNWASFGKKEKCRSGGKLCARVVQNIWVIIEWKINLDSKTRFTRQGETAKKAYKFHPFLGLLSCSKLWNREHMDFSVVLFHLRWESASKRHVCDNSSVWCRSAIGVACQGIRTPHLEHQQRHQGVGWWLRDVQPPLQPWQHLFPSFVEFSSNGTSLLSPTLRVRLLRRILC